MSLHQALQRQLKDPELGAGIFPHEGVPPGPLDVPHSRQCAAPGMAQQALRQSGDEGMGRDGNRLLEGLVGEVVEERGVPAP